MQKKPQLNITSEIFYISCALTTNSRQFLIYASYYKLQIKLHPKAENNQKSMLNSSVLQLLPGTEIVFVRRNC